MIRNFIRNYGHGYGRAMMQSNPVSSPSCQDAARLNDLPGGAINMLILRAKIQCILGIFFADLRSRIADRGT